MPLDRIFEFFVRFYFDQDCECDFFLMELSTPYKMPTPFICDNLLSHDFSN